MTYIISYPLWSSVYDSVHETCNMMRFLSLLLLALCPYGVSEVVCGLSVSLSWYLM